MLNSVMKYISMAMAFLAVLLLIITVSSVSKQEIGKSTAVLTVEVTQDMDPYQELPALIPEIQRISPLDVTKHRYALTVRSRRSLDNIREKLRQNPKVVNVQ